MAQYDLVFIKNDASSGVSYNEFKLQKPPGVGYSLTQHPTTGVLSWIQSMNNGGVVSGDFNNYTETGYYIIPNTGTFVNDPKYLDGVLQVFKTTSGVIYQTAHVKPPTNPTNATTFVRHFRPGSPGSWTSWAAMELVYEAPTRPIEDSRAPYSEGAEGSIAASLQAIENALMDHTFGHIREVEEILYFGNWIDSGTYYLYYLEMSGLTGNESVDIIPLDDTIDYVIDAEIFPAVRVSEDEVRIAAKRPPSGDIQIVVRISKST